MKYRNVFIGSISAFAGILLVILLTINLIVVQAGFLKGTNHKYMVEKKLSMSSEELDKVVDKMVSYVKGQEDSAQIVVEINGERTDFFNDKELGHLLDVRELIKKLYGTMILLLTLCVLGECILLKKKEYVAIIKGIFMAWIIMLAVAVFIAIMALIDIDLVITGFHQMFLSDSNWILNPALDRSVWMFMPNMYIEVLIAIGAIVGSIAFITIFGAVIAKKHVKEEKCDGKSYKRIK